MGHLRARKDVFVAAASLLLLSFFSVSLGAEEVMTANLITLLGSVKVTQADGTTVTLTDTSKPIVLPATIEMLGPKGSFSISFKCSAESGLTDKFNTMRWTMRQGETVRISPLANNRGVKFEYVKGTRPFYLDVNNRENVLTVRSISGAVSVVLLQNKVSIPQSAAARITSPMNTFASVGVGPAQVSEIEFGYSAEDRFTQVLEIVSEAGTLQVAQAATTLPVVEGGVVTRPLAVPAPERFAIAVPSPETVEQSPYRIRITVRTRY